MNPWRKYEIVTGSSVSEQMKLTPIHTACGRRAVAEQHDHIDREEAEEVHAQLVAYQLLDGGGENADQPSSQLEARLPVHVVLGAGYEVFAFLDDARDVVALVVAGEEGD